MSITIYEQIQRSIDFIEDNLFSKLTYEKVAKAVFMSSRSFYNYFWAVTGFSYKEYVIKRRLSEGMRRLQESDETVLSTALTIGYESHEAFTRAFKNEFGVTPSNIRKEPKDVKGIEKLKLIKEMYMGVITKQLPDMRVVYFDGFAPNPEHKGKIKMLEWIERSGLKNKPYRVFGHNIDYDGNIDHNPKNVGYRFFVTIPDDFDVEGVDVMTLKGGNFVVNGIEGDPEADGEWITEGWMRMQSMVDAKNYSYKRPGRWFEEELEPSKKGNLRLDLYAEID